MVRTVRMDLSRDPDRAVTQRRIVGAKGVNVGQIEAVSCAHADVGGHACDPHLCGRPTLLGMYISMCCRDEPTLIPCANRSLALLIRRIFC